MGSLATAGSAYLGGSGFERVPSVNPLTLLSGQKGVLLPICWVVGTALLISAWWWGRHVVPSTRWALITTGLWLLPVLPFLPLGSADVYSYACQGYVQHAGGDPYAMGVQEFGCPWLDSVATSWRDSPAPYGPLFLILAAWAVGLAGDSLGAVIAGLRVIALAGLALTALGLPVLARRAGKDPARAVWLVLACPLVLVHLVSGAHNDALMIGLIVAGLALIAKSATLPPTTGQPSLLNADRSGFSDAAQQDQSSATEREDPDRLSGTRGGLGRPAWRVLAFLVGGGVVLGLAVAVKATAVVVLPFAVLAVVRNSAPLRALWRPAVAIGGGALLATAVLSLVSGRGFGWVAGLARSGDSVTWGSPSTAVGLTVEFLVRLFGPEINAVPVTRAIGVVLLAVILVALWWRARQGGALPGAGLALAATVLCAPVFHPWYATWPLAVLATTGTRLRDPATTGSRAGDPQHPATGGIEDDNRWLLGLCAFAATLTLPAGYNWALYTRIPGAIVVTAALVVLAVVQVRRRRVFA
ncbi:polyprenol phosphomannose-dependent alpha 1,6 mannosyltransferase MptB [Actinoplanes friuliensis]|uniref:polyprenol phosphomannose-dependent alpha 1,6 mannosyltransferase MptB n=1 Tax=Actinoplanes friuliensis TaxID=196914 RepID=UPI00041846C3|nr:polyprenol phosphomannose-dependent alpha 1,6 mannosyltransferase MptB [Actinoplanes friuliensis]